MGWRLKLSNTNYSETTTIPINLRLRELGVYEIRITSNHFIVEFLCRYEVIANDLKDFNSLIKDIEEEFLETRMPFEAINEILSYICEHSDRISSIINTAKRN